jgi:3-oxoacyl-[acyl-carrier protein] reductase
MKRLEGKTAIITGSSRGIGRAVAEQLADLGANVVINYIKSDKSAAEAVNGIIQKGGRAAAVQADVSKVAEVEKLFAQTIDLFGKVNILVNSAGVSINKPIVEVTEADFDLQFGINVKGTYFACQQAMKYMEDNGRIVNFSTSIVGQMYTGFSVYTAAKGAVEQITRQLAKEFGPKKITVNAIAPGPVLTEMLVSVRTPEQFEVMKKMNAFDRIGEPKDIADVIEFLVDEKSRWVTGQTLRVNGGSI